MTTDLILPIARFSHTLLDELALPLAVGTSALPLAVRSLESDIVTNRRQLPSGVRDFGDRGGGDGEGSGGRDAHAHHLRHGELDAVVEGVQPQRQRQADAAAAADSAATHAAEATGGGHAGGDAGQAGMEYT